MDSNEVAFADALANAIAADIRRHPPRGSVVRLVVRWFLVDDPLYFTVHALGTRTARKVDSEDAWYPLEWPGATKELQRADRVEQDPAVARTGAALEQHHADTELEEEPSPAIVEVVRRVPGALRAHGVEVAEDFAVSAAHFEGHGARQVLERVADAALLGRLGAAGALPDT